MTPIRRGAENFSDSPEPADVHCPTVFVKRATGSFRIGETAKFRDGIVHCPN
jgi:hypothetical protein